METGHLIECIVCNGKAWWVFMAYIIEPLDHRKNKLGVCYKCQNDFKKMIDYNRERNGKT